MEGALGAGVHYLDLGGLYHVTRRQLDLDARFRAAGRLAVLGIGSSPGKTNLMAALGARELDSVESIHVSAASSAPPPPDGVIMAPYALETIFDELILPPVVIREGRAVELVPLAAGGDVDFPEPLGRRQAVYTLHSELATFAASFPGLREASFRLSLPPALHQRLELLVELGLAGTEELAVDGHAVSPRAFLLAALRRRGAIVAPSPESVAIHLVEMAGSADGQSRRVRVGAVTRPHAGWGFGGGVVSTSAPMAEAVRVLIRGEIDAVGVMPPEQLFEPAAFLEALKRTGCEVTVRVD